MQKFNIFVAFSNLKLLDWRDSQIIFSGPQDQHIISPHDLCQQTVSCDRLIIMSSLSRQIISPNYLEGQIISPDYLDRQFISANDPGLAFYLY